MIGKTISHYHVTGALGAGGMGEVYRATDTRLDRDVALKVLPAGALADEAARKRFRKEALALSKLNHSNIAVVHDFDTQDGIDFLVMEFVEGTTLAGRIVDGALSEKEAAKIGAQVAEALEEAHEQGVVHRDLKPGNVMVTSRGRVKVLDFGLAKLLKTEGPDVSTMSDSSSTTVAGTLPYMSPEQLQSEPVDARTDLYALGVLLYETATGRRPFLEDTAPKLTDAILHHEPVTPRALNARVTPEFERIILKSLEKDPDERYQSAKEVAVDLRRLRGSTSDLGITRRHRAPWQKIEFAWTVAGVLTASLVFVIGTLWKPPPPQPVRRFAISLPSIEALESAGWGSLVEFSPDGTVIVFSGRKGGRLELYFRRMDQLEPTLIPGTEGAFNPFFSPDGQWIGFFADGKLRKVSLGGGPPLTICATGPDPRGATWAPDDTIIFAPAGGSGLSRVSAADGTPGILTTLDPEKGETSHRWPKVLPDGKAVLYTVALGESGLDVALRSLENDERFIVIRGGAHARYVPTGHLVYARPPSGEAQVGIRGGLLAVPFDLARLRVTASPVSILEGVEVWPGGAAHFGHSDDGSLVYASAGSQADRRFAWVDRQGKAEPLTEERRLFSSSRLSPDGKRVAVSILGGGGRQNIWIYERARDTLSRFTFQQGRDMFPIWTPDGKRMAFQSYYQLEGRRELLWKPVDGSGEAELLLSSDLRLRPYSWTPDGRLLAFSRSSPTTRRDIWLLPVEGDRKPQPFLQTPFSEDQPMFSPDGRWIAYVSDESGRGEVYVRPYPGPGGKVQISTEGGDQPRWAPRGRELFYRSGNKMMAAAITTKPSFTVGTPKALFEISGGLSYDVAPDGRRFLFVKESEDQPAANQLNVVLNWFDEVRRRVASAGQN